MLYPGGIRVWSMSTHCAISISSLAHVWAIWGVGHKIEENKRTWVKRPQVNTKKPKKRKKSQKTSSHMLESEEEKTQEPNSIE
jgi:hypothetical protein